MQGFAAGLQLPGAAHHLLDGDAAARHGGAAIQADGRLQRLLLAVRRLHQKAHQQRLKNILNETSAHTLTFSLRACTAAPPQDTHHGSKPVQ